jgi:hypothetical protein
VKTTAAVTESSARSPIDVLDDLLVEAGRAARVLPALVAKNAPAERVRLVRALEAGELPVPAWEFEPKRADPAMERALEQAAGVARRELDAPLGQLYAERFEEISIDLAMLAALGDGPRVRALAARRYGTGAREVEVDGAKTTVAAIARGILDTTSPDVEARTLPADGGPRSMAGALRIAALASELDLEVRVEPRLGAGAAAGDRTIFVASRRFGEVECVRLVAHEILGHAVAATNGARARRRILEVGTAGSFADQEGLAIALEAQAGALDDHRRRVLAARVVAADRMHAGASFGETARHLREELTLPADVAITTAERAYRGGGVARDAGYLYGYASVSAALANGTATIDELRMGRVSLASLPVVRALIAADAEPVTLIQPATDLVIKRVRRGLAR